MPGSYNLSIISRDVKVKVRLKAMFTAVCPFSDTKDIYEAIIEYEPNEERPYYIELRSLNKYLASFHNTKITHEELAEKITKDIYKAIRPKRVRVILKCIYEGIRVEVEKELTREGEKEE